MFSQKIKRERREAAVCAALVVRLQEAVQSILQPGGRGDHYESRGAGARPVIGILDNENALCNVLEAIFIHGLRDSLGERMSSFLGSDPDRMPVPNFWPVILVISHRDLMEQVGGLAFINSEVGRSRSWVRLALNQGQLCSYLSVLLQDIRTLKDYYRPTAFLRDAERSDIVLSVLQPIASLTFSFATNAAVLNTWTQTPLILAGLWAPSTQTMVADPVLAATDVASTVFDQPVRELAIPIVETPVSDQIFDLIIGGTPDTNFIKDSIEKKEKGVAKGIRENGKDKSVNSYDAQVTADQTVISVIVEERDNSDNTDKINESINVTSDDIEKEDLETSCGNLMNSLSDSFTESTYKRGWSVDSTQSQSGPAFGRIFADFEASNPFMFVNSENLDVGYNTLSADSTPSPDSSRSDDAEKLNYEVVPGQPLSPEDMGRLLPVLTRLTTEEGLDSQAYQCYECKSYIGMIYGKPRVCSYDSKYYCYECHEEEMTLIPSRLIHNWDFGSYGVCRKNGRWLYAIHHQPLIDLRTVNPKLYCHVDDLAEMQILRTQLLYVRAYLFTCKSDAGENLRKMLWPRDHMYEHVHLYSVSDLLLVGQGQLVPEVRQAVTFGRDHVIHCDMCLPRGFICELCSDKEIIFPFQLGSTYTCGECYGVYHSACARGQKDCRRCVRREARKASIVDDTEE